MACAWYWVRSGWHGLLVISMIAPLYPTATFSGYMSHLVTVLGPLCHSIFIRNPLSLPRRCRDTYSTLGRLTPWVT